MVKLKVFLTGLIIVSNGRYLREDSPFVFVGNSCKPTRGTFIISASTQYHDVEENCCHVGRGGMLPDRIIIVVILYSLRDDE